MSSPWFEDTFRSNPELINNALSINNFLADQLVDSVVSAEAIAAEASTTITRTGAILKKFEAAGLIEKSAQFVSEDCEEPGCIDNYLQTDRSTFYCDICDETFTLADVDEKHFYKIKKQFKRIVEEKKMETITTDKPFLEAAVSPISASTQTTDFHYTQTKASGTDTEVILNMINKYGICWYRLLGERPAKEVVEAIARVVGHVSANQNDFEGEVKSIQPKSDGRKNSGSTTDELGYHVDGTQASIQPALLIFMYENQADVGADSWFVDVASVLSKMPTRERNQIITDLSLPDAATFSKLNQSYTGPIFRYEEKHRSFAIRNRLDEVIDCNPLCKDSLGKLNEAISSEKEKVIFQPEKGDLVIFDNWRLMHGRAEVISKNPRSHFRTWIDDIRDQHLSKCRLGIRPFDIQLLSQIQLINIDH